MGQTHILIHNLGHHDLYLRIDPAAGATFIARPSGVAIGSVAKRLLDEIEDFDVPASPPFQARVRLTKFPLSTKTNAKRLQLTESQAASVAEGGDVVALEFRNVVAVVDRWLSGLPETDPRTILIVTSQPEEQAIAGSGTYQVGQLMKRFLAARWPGLSVELLDPLTENPFRLASMSGYVRDTVRRRVDALIRAEIGTGYEGWANDVTLTLSASTGTTAMISALHEGFRDLAPSFIHVPNARKRPDDDELPLVDLYSFRDAGHRGSIPRSALQSDEAEVVNAMIGWRDSYVETQAAEHELEQFWLRKGLKPVLAVLAVSTPDGLAFHRACNLEVSLPTGTLCAERNAIGSALAANPALARADIRMVAVLSLDSLDKGRHMNPLGPCGACMEWLRKVAEVTPNLRVLTFEDVDCADVYVDRVT